MGTEVQADMNNGPVQETQTSGDIGGAPVIDLTGIEGPSRERIMREVSAACEEWGFFQVVNHGVDLAVMKRAKDASKEFFASPDEEKLKFAMKKNVHFHGYFNPDLMDKDVSKFSSTYEHLYYVFYPPLQEHKDRWPTIPEGFGPAMYEYVVESRGLVERILGLLSESLGVESHALFNGLKGPDVTQSNMNISFYNAKKEGEGEDQIALLGHTDPGAVTVVYSDEVVGLQVQKGDRWLDIEPTPNSLIVNLGDQLQIMSNGRFISGNHRVVEKSSKRRLSIINFYSPNMDAIIGPLDGLLSESNPPVYKSTPYRVYLDTFRQRARAQLLDTISSFKVLSLSDQEPSSESTIGTASTSSTIGESTSSTGMR
ncbi:protein MpDOXC18 [Marchantia polymorpha subsp. ruderalis]|uniref:Fe2OG dioxygenase domain-containing protein n=2 Tax=Marchantia polymorpha TaxID=3197 RepID=A0AAF6AZK9_MARPO|nr:hypothetical protein MARPO_0037s0086 [Marchantia polymorpha]BBN05193.1 hypothetical protein Mp_3g11110 [Marchantia polymorpha subsp. ruderalis]|eukprot:PTQ40911.1 hypothetical protein MARPO_0037s0086 [Marchantia polymorpha]